MQGAWLTNSMVIPCKCCNMQLRVETNKIDNYTGTYCIYLNSFLLCNGGLYMDEEEKLHKKHFFHNEQLYTNAIFRHVLMYIRQVEDSFLALTKKKAKNQRWTRVSRVKKIKI